MCGQELGSHVPAVAALSPQECLLPCRHALASSNFDAVSTLATFRYVQALESYVPAVAAMTPQKCELLYGRAGYLYALLCVWRAGGSAAADGAGAEWRADSAGPL